MNKIFHFQALLQSLGSITAQMTPPNGHSAFQTDPVDGADGRNGGMWQRMTGHSPELFDVSEEVAAEQQTRMAMLSRSRDLNLLVLSYLRQQPVQGNGEQIVREGAWVLIALPEVDQDSDSARSGRHVGYHHVGNDMPDDEYFADGSQVNESYWRHGEGFSGDLLDDLADIAADVLLYLVDARQGWQDADAQWYARLRALGTPSLPVLVNVVDAEVFDDRDAEPARFDTGHFDTGHFDTEQAEKLRVKLAIQPVILEVFDPPVLADALPDEPPADVIELTNRLLSIRPKVAIPLAQDIAWCRHTIATRVIRTGALVTALVGLEPIPLLDLPIHVALQWKVALQLAAIHGRPGLDFRSREMVGTIGLNLCMRYLAQQVLKLIPVIGWMLSGALSGLSTWLFGHALLRYYENDQIWSWSGTKEAWHKQATRRIGAMREKTKRRPMPGVGTLRTNTAHLSQRIRVSRQAAAHAWRQSPTDGTPDTSDEEKSGLEQSSTENDATDSHAAQSVESIPILSAQDVGNGA